MIDRGQIGKLVDGLTDLSEALGFVIDKVGLLNLGGLGLEGLLMSKGLGFVNYDKATGQTTNLFSKLFGSQAFEDFNDDTKEFINNVSKFGKGASSANFKEFAGDLENVDKQVIRVAENMVGGSFKAEKFEKAIYRVRSASTETSAALKSLSAVAQSMLVTVGIEVLINVIMACVTASDKLLEKASQLGSQFSATKDDIDSYKDKIKELQDKINDSSTSYADAKKAREDLLGIQDELIKKYGKEESAINDITTAIYGEVEALDKLSDAKWKETLQSLEDPGSGIEGFFGKIGQAWNSLTYLINSSTSGNLNSDTWDEFQNDLAERTRQIELTTSQYEILMGQMDHIQPKLLSLDMGKDDLEILKSLPDSYETISGLDDGFIRLDGNIFQAYEDVTNLYSALKDAGASQSALAKVSKVAAEFNRQINDSNEIWSEGILRDRIFDSTELGYSLESEYEEYLNLQKKYNEALVNGNDSLASSFITSLAELQRNINEKIVEDGLTNEERSVLAFFDRIDPVITNKIKQYNLERDFASGSSITKQLETLEKGGNVDLVLRAKGIDIPDEDLKKLGIKAGEDVATVFSSTFSNESGDVAVNFTPIITDKNGKYLGVMEDPEFTNYCEDVIAGVRQDDLNLQIGAEFTGEDAIQQAEAVAIKIHDLHDQFKNASTGLSGDQKEFIKAFEEFGNQESLLSVEFNDLTDSQKTAYRIIDHYAQEYGYTIDGLINKLRTMTELSDFDRAGNRSLVRAYNRANDSDYSVERRKANRQRNSAFVGGLNSLSDADYATAQTFSAEQWQQVEDNMRRIMDEQGLITEGAEQYNQAISEVIQGVRELKDTAENTKESLSFSQTISNLNDLESALNDLGTAMSNIDDQGQFQLGDLDKLADYFIGLEDTKYQVDEVNNALKLLGEGTGTIDEQANAINTLADNYLHASNVLEGLTQSNKQLYITRLEMMGIINAEEIVEAQLTAVMLDEATASEYLSQIKAQVVVENGQLVVSEGEAINAMVKDGQISQDTARQVAYFAYQKEYANQTVIRTDADIANLLSLMNTAGAAADAIAKVAQMKSMLSDVESGKTIMSKTRVDNMRKAIADISKSAMGDVKATFTGGVPQAQYNGGSSVKNKLGTTPTSTGGALKDLRNKAAQDAADKAGGGGSSKDPTEEAKKDEEELEDTYDEFFDYFERRLKVVSDAISLLDAHLENVVGSNAKNTLLDAQMRIYKMQQQEYADAQNMYQEMADRALAKIEDSNIVEKIKNGAVGIDEFIGKGNEEVVNAINDYTKWADKVADCKQQLAELKETIRQLELTRMKNILQDWQDVFDLRQDNAIDLIDKQISLIEESGNLVGKAFYEQQKRQTEGQLSAMEQAKRELSAELNRGLANGSIEVGTDEWIEEVGLLQEVESNILDCKQAIEEYDNAILAIHTDTFERLIDKFDDLDDELSDIAAFFDDEKVGDKFGNWSEAGQAQAGLLAQQYELAQNKVKKYAEQIDWLNGQYNAGKYSTTEYTEQLAELMDAMRESAKDAESAKEAMLDLNKARVDIVIDGINEEIEAYSDLISKEKDALSAEKDLHDYRKQIAESNKSIVAIQKQLAAIENDNSQKARAQRAKLQQQLKDAQDALAEQEYDHSVEMQQQALDEQLEQYKDTRQKEIDELNAYVENSQQVLTDMFENVRANAESIGQTIVQTAQEHGFQVSTSLTESWKAGENAIASYGAVLTPATSEFIAQLENVEQQTWDLQDQADKTAVSLADMFGTRADTLVGELQRSWQAEANAQAMADALRQSMVYALESGYDISSVVSSLNSVANAAKDVAEAANDAAGALDNAISKQNAFNNMPKSSDLTHITTIYNNPNANQVNWDYIGGHTSLNSSKSSNSYSTTIPGLGKKTKKHARGLSKAEQDELAWTQELGDEIIISPTRNSILTPIKKNDSVLTAEMTKNLFELAKINPNDILQGSGANVVAPQIESTNNSVSIGNLVNVEGSISSENLDAVKATIQSELKKTFRNINSGLRR